MSLAANASLAGKTALITGAGQGIGLGCALALAQKGACVAINDKNTHALDDAARQIEELGATVFKVPGNVFDRAGCEQVLKDTLTQTGQALHILVSNPALNVRQSFLEYDPNEFERVMQAVLFGGFHMSQLVARHLVAQGQRGKIVFISSVHARWPYSRSVAYNAGKFGLNGMALTIANELTPYRINVNVIEPGWIDTPGERRSFGDEAINAVAATRPWGRLGMPQDVGQVAAFLSSEESDYITGTTLVVDGGQWLRHYQE